MEQRGAAARSIMGPYREIVLQWRRGAAMVDFRDLALTDPTLALGGVYVIHTGKRAHRVGQATRLRDRLRTHQQDSRIVNSTCEPLAVAWAVVPRACRAAVEAFLGGTLRPDVAERFPAVSKLMVNLPDGVPRVCQLRPHDCPRTVTRTGWAAGSSASRSTEINVMASTNESTATEAVDVESDFDRLGDAIRTIAWLHAKDAKNASNHWERECMLCATIADVQNLVQTRKENASRPPLA